MVILKPCLLVFYYLLILLCWCVLFALLFSHLIRCLFLISFLLCCRIVLLLLACFVWLCSRLLSLFYLGWFVISLIRFDYHLSWWLFGFVYSWRLVILFSPLLDSFPLIFFLFNLIPTVKTLFQEYLLNFCQQKLITFKNHYFYHLNQKMDLFCLILV